MALDTQRSLRRHIRHLADVERQEKTPSSETGGRRRQRPSTLTWKDESKNFGGEDDGGISPDLALSMPFGGTSSGQTSRKISTGSDGSDSGNGSLRPEDYVCNSASVSPVPPPAVVGEGRGRSSRRRTSATTTSENRRRLLGQPQQPQPPHLERVKSFNRNVRRARSFRGMRRERSLDCMAMRSKAETPAEEVTFALSQRKHGRRGWKVMPDGAGGGDLRDPVVSAAVERVAAMIRQMEFAGHVVPEKITIKLS